MRDRFHFPLDPTLIGRAVVALFAALALTQGGSATAVTSATTLADQPVFATANVPGNVAFTLSVEFPTAVSVANLGNYADNTAYIGYFDPAKCYTYHYNSTTPAQSYFQPTAFATGTNGHTCSGTSGKWSGNFMNWVSMQTIDPFRWVLTGGYRSTDQTVYPQTVLEKAWGASEGSTGNFPYRGDQMSSGNTISMALVKTTTPFTNWAHFTTAIWGNQNTMLVTAGPYYTAGTTNPGVFDMPSDTYDNVAPPSGQSGSPIVPNASTTINQVYRVYIRVSVCDTSALGTLGLESNCVGYGTPSSSGVYPTYKPQGLVQQYANQIKFAVLGYLNTANTSVQGGVLRAPMEYVGPTYPQPFSATAVTNPNAEWSATTGVLKGNPDTAAASASGVTQSGVINYLNGFGEYGASQYLAGNTNYLGNANIYMTYDRVSEMYYAAIRYFENLGNVPQWLPTTSVAYEPPTSVISPTSQNMLGYAMPASVQLDGFPAVTTWTDPIAYSCQNNFIVGIGDDHTWSDWNVGGAGYAYGISSLDVLGHAPTPPLVESDSFNQGLQWTYDLQILEGMNQDIWWTSDYNSQGHGQSGTFSTFMMAGLAYGAHVLDIRSDLAGTQTISTYWMDVAEGQEVENLNPFYLASKYGGFTVPTNYSISNTTPLPLSEYDPTGATINMNGTTQNLPTNYFNAGTAANMVSSLTSAFANIAVAAKNDTTAIAVPNPNIASSGSLSFSSAYNSSGWTGTVTGYALTFSNGAPVETQNWVSDSVLQTQLANNGWSTARKVVTYSNGSGCSTTYAGAPFEYASLCSTQLTALLPTSYSPNTTSTQYLSYLRGDTSNQVGQTASSSTKSLRARTLFLGDIADAALVPVGTPSLSYTEANNPGYTAFTTQWTTTTPRPTMVYAAANDGMLHGFLGTTGTEVFAYVPSALYQGPTGTPLVNGLAAIGNPYYTHHYYVDATPGAFDIDLNHTYQSGSTSPNWHTVLIGGLGKGGTSYYAIDVTDPATMQSSTESQIAQKVLWEFTDPTMGYSFATPVVVKTVQYGWVVLFTSGYDNSDGYGYVYVVNPANGTLLQKIKTPSPSEGLTQLSAYVQDYTDFTADSAYVGDLNGNVWRFSLTAASGNYPAPFLLATLTDPSGNAQPVTSAPLIEIHPTTRERYVLIGTGQLLAVTDVGSTQVETFYALIDGTAGGYNTSQTTATTRSTLTPITNLTTPTTLSSSSPGWYYDLSAGYRVISQPAAYNGVVAFTALLPSTSDPCNPGGTSEVFAVNYAVGESVLYSTTNTGSTVTVAYDTYTTPVTSVQILGNGSTAVLVASETTGSIPVVPANLNAAITTRLLNWREIPTPD